jgi:hypothetical protein
VQLGGVCGARRRLRHLRRGQVQDKHRLWSLHRLWRWHVLRGLRRHGGVPAEHLPGLQREIPRSAFCNGRLRAVPPAPGGLGARLGRAQGRVPGLEWQHARRKAYRGRREHRRCVGQSNGAGSGILVPLVGGSITAYINWGDSSVPATFTVCSISRYSGATKERILTCSDRNWLHGNWGVYGTKYAGATFYDKDMYLQYGISPDTNWVVSCGRNVVGTGRSNTIMYSQFRKWVSAARKCWSQRFEGSLPVRRRWGCA